VTDPRDYKVELSGADGASTERPRTAVRGNAESPIGTQRPFLSVHFACCGVYQRVYRDPGGKAYHGRCPRCARAVTFAVGEGGTSARSFVVR
jgi:hypothetical protein